MSSLKDEFLYTEDINSPRHILKTISANYSNKENGVTLLMRTININNMDKIKLLLSYNVNISATNINGDTALYYAVCVGNYEIVKLLLDNGADPNHRNKFGRNILNAVDGNEKIKNLLIERGANQN